MKKKPKPSKFFKIRRKYQEKRLGYIYKQYRKSRLDRWKKGESRFFKKKANDLINLPAPENFSLIENTSEVLNYIKYARAILRDQNSIILDISKIKNLTPDTIPLLISHIKDPNFNKFMTIHGNAPSDEKFRKIFTESGFYKHVRSDSTYEVSQNNLMHKESNFKVKPDLAGDVVNIILNKNSYNEEQIEAIYNIFIELMSNTHHHANLAKFGISKWWLFLFIDSDTRTISISFIDLGVGIFKSMIVRSYLKRMGLNAKILDNSSLVKDLLGGKIQSRIEKDNEIRGKGIPQVVDHAKLDCFEKFYLITNDVKIDLKNDTFSKLSSELKGTFYHIELKY